MSKILIITGRYLPGYKDGGPVRTIKNLTDNLGDRYTFVIMCADRDHDDERPYDGIKVNALNQVDKALVYYSGDCMFKLRDIKRLCSECDLVYVCGPYNGYSIKTLVLKRLGFIKMPLVLAPMGSFSKGALMIGESKKRLFFKLCKALGLYKGVYFSVTSEVEKREFREALGLDNKCYIAEDMPRNVSGCANAGSAHSDTNMQTNIIFLSRISPKKNLLYAIDLLSGVNKNITFHIYGHIEDKDYYEQCREKLNSLPDNISWKYMGEADSEEVPDIFSKYDMFLFPTLGENYGHVISEALSAGCIPVISDTTPWFDLSERDCGYVIPFSDRQQFIKTITHICEMTTDEINAKSENARKYYMEKASKSINESGYREMFDELLRQGN